MPAFSDNVVWITGASSGIGEALARVFAQAGARVVLSARRRAELERVQATLARADETGRHLVLPLDLAAPVTFAGAVEAVRAHFGRVDLLINNGGIGQRGFAAETTVAIDRAIMEVNFFGQVALTKATLPVLQRQRSGRIVVISSVVGYVATPRRSAYAASKHALHGFFNALRAEVWRDGIRVTLVCPGYVHTKISINALTASGSRHDKVDAAQRRAISAEHFANRLLPALAIGREEVYIGGREIWAIYLQRLFPRVVARLLRRINFS